MKKHQLKDLSGKLPPAYLSNGLIGFRIGANPLENVQGVLQGFTSVKEWAKVEAYAGIPTPEIQFLLNDEPAIVSVQAQSYDFSCAELETELELKTSAKTVHVMNRIFCSRTSPTLLISSFTFQTQQACRITMDVSYQLLRNRKKDSRCVEYFPPDHEKHYDYDGQILVESADGTTQCGIAYKLFTEQALEVQAQQQEWMGNTASWELTPNQPVVIHHVTSYVPGIMHREPHNQAVRMLKLAAWNGCDRIRKQNQEQWAEIWKSRIVVDGAGEKWQDAIDASFFYLFTSMHRSSPMSIAPYGLSSLDAYEGHSFWDTESFMYLLPLLCAPDIAENLLEYRFDRIDAARDNARLNGYRGIQFPWQSGRSGCEVTAPIAGQAGGAGEQHINLDVALAFDAYARVTQDDVFRKERAWPVIRGVAQWIESRVEKTSRGYEILHVTGIDEETDDVMNDSYTNILSARVLRLANQYAKVLGYKANPEWEKIADGLIIPIDAEKNYLQQYENCEEKPKMASTTLMSYFPYGYRAENPETDRNTYQFYIEHGMKDYLRYPMQSGYLGIFPAWLGDPEMSLEYFEKANFTFFCEPYFTCVEYSIPDPKERECLDKSVETLFLTGRGSLLAGLMMGLTKFNLWKEDTITDIDFRNCLEEKISLPKGWKKITLNRIYLAGKPYQLIAENGSPKAVLTPLPTEI
jgi:trehalose/maltose hydrolase-like predicted phosphorylase